MAPRLTAMGHRTITPDLPGHGDDRTPVAAISLESYVAASGEVLKTIPDRVILVSHSMSGIVITQAAERWPYRIGLLVYVAAFLPANGQSLAVLAAGDTESRIGPNSVPSGDGLAVTVREAAIAELFYADCPADDITLARTRLVPEPLAPLLTPVHTTAGKFGRVPRAYVECLRDRALPLARQRLMQAALPCAPVLAMDTGHAPFFAAPHALAEALARLAGAAALDRQS